MQCQNNKWLRAANRQGMENTDDLVRIVAKNFFSGGILGQLLMHLSQYENIAC